MTAKVGSVEHPMLDAYYIEFVLLRTGSGNRIQTKQLKPDMSSIDVFKFAPNDKPTVAFGHYNMHRLWKADILILRFVKKRL